jgi:Flp pilus assembly protein TadG
MNRTFSSTTRGQTLVEFALILPIFVFLAVVIFDLGRAVYYYSTIFNAAREGARFGVIYPSAASYDLIKDEAIKYAVALDLSRANVNVEPGPIENAGGINNPTIKVTVNYTFTPVTPLVSRLFPCGCGYIVLSSEAVMRTEALP